MIASFIASLKRHIGRCWAAAPVASALFALALAAALLFGVRSAVLWADRHERIAREQPVAAWMTPRYVAHSWHLPRRAVIEALALTPGSGPPRATLAELAADRNVPVSTLIDALETAIADNRASLPDASGDEQSEELSPGDTPSEQLAPTPDGGGAAE